jgi:hypothetical protein
VVEEFVAHVVGDDGGGSGRDELDLLVLIWREILL